jgi:nitric oxide reductase large subunit
VALVILMVRCVGHEVGLVIGFGGYAASGPVAAVLRRVRGRARAAEGPAPAADRTPLEHR